MMGDVVARPVGLDHGSVAADHLVAAFHAHRAVRHVPDGVGCEELGKPLHVVGVDGEPVLGHQLTDGELVLDAAQADFEIGHGTSSGGTMIIDTGSGGWRAPIDRGHHRVVSAPVRFLVSLVVGPVIAIAGVSAGGALAPAAVAVAAAVLCWAAWRAARWAQTSPGPSVTRMRMVALTATVAVAAGALAAGATVALILDLAG